MKRIVDFVILGKFPKTLGGILNFGVENIYKNIKYLQVCLSNQEITTLSEAITIQIEKNSYLSITKTCIRQ